MTKDEELILRHMGFTGPRPGSNFWPMLSVQIREDCHVDGEAVDSLYRKGFISAKPHDGGEVIPSDDEEETPEIEKDFEWFLTPDGKKALDEIDGQQT